MHDHPNDAPSTGSTVTTRPKAGPAAWPAASKGLAALVLAGFVAGATFATGYAHAESTVPQQAVPQPSAPVSFADIVERVTPAVVNISTTAEVDMTAMGRGPESPFPDLPPGSPLAELFRHFFNQVPPGAGHERREIHALGSGFIIDPAGYVVTNNHVIDGADDITVIDSTGQRYVAKLIGHDQKTDLALLKIDADKPLPYVSFGDSDKVRVGDWVLAIGNPFGLGGTVTAGIVSAHGRNLGNSPFDDFLQIDAPINRGNSGGPTFNLAGEVIGINSAIYSPNGGSVGIGFAVPSSLAKQVVAQLRDHGAVERGWLGVQVQAVTPDIASALGLDKAEGALVAGVAPDSPAAKAGIKQGDVILGMAGERVEKLRDLPRLVADIKPGKQVEADIRRGGDELTLTVDVGRMPQSDQVAANGNEPGVGRHDEQTSLGLDLAALTPRLRGTLGIPHDVQGVLVTDVRPDSPAAHKGLRQGDLIEQVGGEPVDKPADVVAGVNKAKSEKRNTVLLLVNRGGNEQFIALPFRRA